MKLKLKIVFLLVSLMLYLNACEMTCKSVTGPKQDTTPKPSSVRVDYQRYVAGGTTPEAADRPGVYLRWGEIYGICQDLIGQDGINYSCSVSIETEYVITGCVEDPKMYDKSTDDSRSVEEIALYVRIDGKDVIKITNYCTSPWSGTFKFIKHNDGTIEFFSK